MNCYKALFILLSIANVAVVSRVAYKYFTKKKQKETEDIQEAIMFSYVDTEKINSYYSRCNITKSMDRLLYYLDQPEYSLDLCIYMLTSMEITNALLKLRHRGVKLRVIVDADMAYSTGSGIKKLSKKGIPVRWMKSTNLMHHKFCLVDTSCANSTKTPYLMISSMSWTNEALSNNNGNCLVTSQKKIVEEFRAEFERLWVLFKPIVD